MVYSILPLNPKIEVRIIKFRLERKFKKQINILAENSSYPSLNVELLNPKEMGIYSFRIDRRYRALFIFRRDSQAIEVLNITMHYQ